MKASKILAGLSAAAIAASMFSMVSVFAAEEVSNSGVVTVEIGENDNAWWKEESIEMSDLLGDVAVEDVVAIEFSTNDDIDFWLGYNSNDYDAEQDSYWKKTDAAKSVRLEADQINFEDDKYFVSVIIGTGKVGDSCQITWNVLTDDGEESTPTDSTESTESTPADEVELPYTVDTEVGYNGDWGSDGLVPMSVINAVPEGEGMQVTVSYTLQEGYDYYLAAPISNTTGWGKVYAEGDRDTITGIDLKSSFTADELEEHGQNVGTPVLQGDGYIIAYPAGGMDQELTFTVTAEGVDFLKAQAAKFAEESEGGMMFQVYGVDITEVTVDVAQGEEENGVYYEIGEGVSFNNPYHFEPTDLDDNTTYTSAKINLTGTSTDLGDEDLNVFWNDWCAYFISVADADGNKTYYAVGGPQVSWDVTCVDAEVEEDKVIIANADVIKTDAEGNVTVEVPFGNGYSIDVVGLSWGEADKTEEQKDAPYILVKDILIGFESVITPDSSSVADSASVADSSSTTSSDATTSTTSSTASTTSTTSSKTTSTTTTTTKTDTNPSTGAAALGAVGVLLAGAAMVVSKKKD